jgi:putative tryptophan/tyrosine transport system substrate-binding protein
MNKKLLAGAVAAVIIIAAGIGWYYFLAQKTKIIAPKGYRIGILSGLSYFADVPSGFKEKMAELGYVDGKNVSYDLHESDYDAVAYKNVIEKFIKEKEDLIFVFPTEPALEAKALTAGAGIPIVFVAANAEQVGLINSVQEPGENITGVRWTGADVALLRFETMHELVPEAKRFLLPYQKGAPIVVDQLKAIHLAAEKYGITITEVPADNPEELAQGLAALTVDDKDVMLMIVEPLAAGEAGFTVLDKFAIEHKIPLGGVYIPGKDYQTLFGLNPDNVEMGKQAAVLVDKVLKGAEAGKIMASSAEPRLTLNYKVIQKMNLTVSESLLNKAAEIIR